MESSDAAGQPAAGGRRNRRGGLTVVERHELYGLGIGYVGAQLLAATRLTAAARLWTSDKRLAAAAAHIRPPVGLQVHGTAN